MNIRGPDVVIGVARGLVRPGRADRAPRHAVHKLRLRRQHRDGVAFDEEAGTRIERQRCDCAGELVQHIDEAVVLRDDQMARSRALL